MYKQDAIDCMFVALQNSYAEIYSPSVIVFGGGAFGSPHEWDYGRNPRELSCPFHHLRL